MHRKPAIQQAIQSELGQTMAEYALILVLIAVFAVGAVTFLGTSVINTMLSAAASMF